MEVEEINFGVRLALTHSLLFLKAIIHNVIYWDMSKIIISHALGKEFCYFWVKCPKNVDKTQLIYGVHFSITLPTCCLIVLCIIMRREILRSLTVTVDLSKFPLSFASFSSWSFVFKHKNIRLIVTFWWISNAPPIAGNVFCSYSSLLLVKPL